MVAACAGSRAQSVTSSRAASTEAIAVPQAPAPRTAIPVTAGSPRDLDLGCAALLLALDALQVERLERDRREQHRWEAAADHEVRDRFAQIGEKDGRTGDAQERLQVVGGDVAHLEDARLHRLGEEQRALAHLGADRSADGSL